MLKIIYVYFSIFRYYHHVLQCIKSQWWHYYHINESIYNYNLKCGLSSIHNWLKDQVLNGSTVYELVQTCEGQNLKKILTVVI